MRSTPRAAPRTIRRMKIVCAESVLYGREAFATLGDVAVMPDRKIGPAEVRDADALVIRSKTPVTRELLHGSRLAFVGTATAGFDHLDTDALAAAGVAWMAAAGCNANSVAEYIVAALLCLARRHAFRLAGRTLGVVGVGQVGRRVVRKAEALGLRVLQNDPPRRQTENAPELRDLDEVLAAADIVTLHVPLTESGPFATRRMVDARWLERLKPGAVFINASRGKVVNESDLMSALDRGRISHAVLDVWDREPAFSADLMKRVDLGTPHIAGYSYDGKLEGTVLVYRAACRRFGRPEVWDPAPLRPPPAAPEIVCDPADGDDEAALEAVVRRVYDIAADDRALREGPDDETARAARFERLRKNYPERREFFNTAVRLLRSAPALARKLKGIGFRTAAA